MMGPLGWPPDTFWNALYVDTISAMEGFAMSQGAELPDDKREREKAKTKALRRLMEKYG
jgi:hypothetical protein